MSYAKELVERLEGTINAESVVGQATVFTVTLPLDTSRTELEAAPPMTVDRAFTDQVEEISAERPRLLIAEDNVELRQFLLSSLAKDYVVTAAENGVVGIRLALETIPDLIVSDLVMPEKDGLQLVDELKNDERTSHVPIVLLTSKSGLEDRISGLARGANAYLGKPFDLRELKLTLRNLLEQQQHLRERYLQQATEPLTDDQQPEDPEERFLEKVRQIVLDNLANEDFKVPDLAKRMGVSRTQLHHKLKALTGESTSLYVRRLRLAAARSLLVQGAMNVSEVAYATGFKYVQHFSRYYAEMYGEVPSETMG